MWTENAPLSGVQRVLLGSLVADPDAAELPLHMLAVEHVPEKHLVTCEGLPAEERAWSPTDTDIINEALAETTVRR